MSKKVFQAVWEQVIQYGNYGSYKTRGGEWVDDLDAHNGLSWEERVAPIDGLDSLFRDHDKLYSWTEKMMRKGDISSSQERLLKTQADIKLLAGLIQYNPSTDPQCKDNMTAQKYQLLALSAFGSIPARKKLINRHP